MAAQAMEGAMSVTNAALGKSGGAIGKGTIVLGTVQGDVHDIGKAIVIAYLKANSYEVYDLGRDCALETFLAKAEEHDADVIGMSALLTTTMEEQKKLIADPEGARRPRQATRSSSAAPPAPSAGPTRSAPTPTPRMPPTVSRRSTPCWALSRRVGAKSKVRAASGDDRPGPLRAASEPGVARDEGGRWDTGGAPGAASEQLPARSRTASGPARGRAGPPQSCRQIS